MATADTVCSWIEDHREELAEFVLEFGSVSSPRGHEGEAGRFLRDWLEAEGIDATLQPVVDDRVNVVGTLPSDDPGDASNLVFNAHLDTAFGNPEEDARTLGERARFHTDVWRTGDTLYGDDVVNDKGPMAAFLWAGLALERTGVELDGTVHLTGVAGEICGTTVDEFQGVEYLGNGLGTRRLVEGGVTGDYALVAETTDFAIARMECGVVWFKITVEGAGSYQPRLVMDDPDSAAEDHPGALPAAARIGLALERWAAEYSAENVREYDHGHVRPSAGVGAIRSGNPYAPAVAPGTASLYVDVRLPPGEGPRFVRGHLKAVLDDLDVEATVEQYLFRRGYVADSGGVEPLIEGIEAAHDAVRTGPIPEPDPAITSMWRDTNIFNEAGIPSVSVGPSRLTETVDGERAQGLCLDNLIDAAKLYARVAVSTCTDAVRD